jgi:hypothetical protein
MKSYPVLAVVLTLMGCGSGSAATYDHPPASSTHQSASPGMNTPAQPRDTAQHATSRQYASIVYRNSNQLSETLADELGRSCLWKRPGGIDLRPNVFSCSIQMATVRYGALRLRTTLSAAQDPRTRHYLGPPATDVASLVQSTMDAATALDLASKHAIPCAVRASAGCVSKLLAFKSAMTTMQSQLAAWRLYR